MSGRTVGLELAADWQAARRWRLRGAYAFLDLDLRNPNPRLAREAEGSDARHQLTGWSSFDLPHDLQLDAVVRHLGRLPHHGVDAYTDLDLRLGAAPGPGLTVAVGGRNLLGPARREYGSGFRNILPTCEARVLYLEATWRGRTGD